MNRSTLFFLLTFFFIFPLFLFPESNKDQIAVTVDGITFIIPTKWEIKEIVHSSQKNNEQKENRLKKILSYSNIRKTILWGSALITIGFLGCVLEQLMIGLAGHLDRLPPGYKNENKFDLDKALELSRKYAPPAL